MQDRLAIVSDEAAPGFAEAVSICLPLGIRAYELRGLYDRRVPDVEPDAVAEVLEQVRQHGLRLLGISPGFGKIRVNDPAVETELAAGFDAAFRLLDRLDVRRMTVFSYLRTSPGAAIPPQAFVLLGQAAARCRAAGVEMLIENSASCWGDTGAHLAALARAAGVCVTWDPANCEAAGQPAYPDGYAFIRDRVAHVHCKNWRPGVGNVPIAEGQADMAGQIAALLVDGYAGYFCIEPHQWSDRANATRINAAQLRALLADH